MNPNLGPCRHCQKEVAKTAKSCPHCGGGTPWIPPKQANPSKWTMLIMFIVLAVSFKMCSDTTVEREKKAADEAAHEKQYNVSPAEAARAARELEERYGHK